MSCFFHRSAFTCFTSFDHSALRLTLLPCSSPFSCIALLHRTNALINSIANSIDHVIAITSLERIPLKVENAIITSPSAINKNENILAFRIRRLRRSTAFSARATPSMPLEIMPNAYTPMMGKNRLKMVFLAWLLKRKFAATPDELTTCMCAMGSDTTIASARIS